MILVTGAGGTIGTEVVRQLREQGSEFAAAFHTATKAEAARQREIESVVVDFANQASLKETMAAIDTLFLLYGGANHARMELNAVEAARAAGVRRIVKLSVWGAESEEFAFATKHRTVERAIQESGLSWCFIRPNSFMQNLGNYFAESIRKEGCFKVPAGEAKISHVDASDVAAVSVAALTDERHDGETYLLSGSEALSYDDIAARISVVIGKEIRYLAAPDDEYRKEMVEAGVSAEDVDSYIGLNRYQRAGHASRTTDDVGRVTGRTPITFDEYALAHAGLFRGRR